MTLPIDRTALTAAQGNQVPNALIRSALNIAALKTPYDTIDELNNKVDAHAAAAVLPHADGSVTTSKIALLAIVTTLLADSAVTSAKILDGTILDVDINATAAIAWTKISKTASSLADLATRLASDLTGTLNVAQLPAETGDVTRPAGSSVNTISNGVVTAAKLDPALLTTNLPLNAHIAANPIDHPNGSVTDIKLDNGATSVKALANAALPKTGGTMTGDLNLNDVNAKLKRIGSDVFLNSAAGYLISSSNAQFNGTNWNRIDTAQPATRIYQTFSGLELYTVAAGANPIVWSAANSMVVADGSVPITGSLSISGALTAGAGGSFANSKAASGYQKLPGGLIMQWGNLSIPSGSGGTTVTFPIAFPTACANATLTPFASLTGITASVFTTSAASMVIAQSYTQSTFIFWMAIGY